MDDVGPVRIVGGAHVARGLVRPRVGFELMGIIYEYIGMVETICARHIHHLLADGRITAPA